MESGFVHTRPDSMPCRDKNISRSSQFRQLVKSYVRDRAIEVPVSHVTSRNNPGAEPVRQILVTIGRFAVAEIEYFSLNQFMNRQDTCWTKLASFPR